MKTKIIAAVAAIVSFILSATAIAQTLEAFSTAGPAVTKSSMATAIANTDVRPSVAPTVSEINFGARLTLPSDGTLNIIAVSYRRYFNGVLKVSNTLAAFNPPGDDSRPDMRVENTAGTIVSVNGVQSSGASMNNARMFLLEDHRIILNGTTAPFLGAAGDNHRMEYRFKGSFNGNPFDLTTSATVVVVPPPSVSNLVATALGLTKVQLNWTDVPTETSYRVMYSSDGGLLWTFVSPMIVPQNTTSYIVSGLKPGVNYQFRVVTVETADSTESPSVYGSTLSLPTLSVQEGQSILTLTGGYGMTQEQVSSLLQVSTDLQVWTGPPEGTIVLETPAGWHITVPSMPPRCFFRFLTGETTD